VIYNGQNKNSQIRRFMVTLEELEKKLKRITRSTAYRRRNRMILSLIEQYRGEKFGNNHLRVIWNPVLPKDLAQLAANEQILVQTGIHSRKRAMDEIGVTDPDYEFKRWLEEREVILRMNKELNTRPARAEREREPALKTGEVEE
jgi:hypothetical protein